MDIQRKIEKAYDISQIRTKQPEEAEPKPMDQLMEACLLYTSRLLRCAGKSEQANEMADRVHKSGNYYEALGIISEYVETELSDHREPVSYTHLGRYSWHRSIHMNT